MQRKLSSALTSSDHYKMECVSCRHMVPTRVFLLVNEQKSQNTNRLCSLCFKDQMLDFVLDKGNETITLKDIRESVKTTEYSIQIKAN